MPARHARRPRHLAAGRRRLLGWGAAALVVAVATTVALLLTGQPGSAPPAPAGVAATGAADQASADLLAWAAQELPTGARLEAAADVRADLVAAGAPEELVTTTGPTGPDDVLLEVTTGVPPPGARVLARFGDLLVVDSSPGVPTPAQLDRRRSLAAALLANPTVRVDAPAAAVLEGAEVDARLLMLLAALGAQQGVGVAAFPGVSGTDGLPARSVLLDSFGGAPVGTGAEGTDTLLTWLDAQLPPFAPDGVTVTADGVVISHRYAADPDAVVSAPGP
ncbi:hypothetical protein GCU56_05990 [Geodermatophilus sabuli]|uniref:Uncharacterized protein n=1 Tax=Geodermatophilus sabuli TaxID=1564158 RepID=A0A7K3VZ93_9ACTN|nr:hypothetical protein [Geodermatophilus sabuli]NEK57423.1 hypothetical protein [Geodermatophilus sabuli]